MGNQGVAGYRVWKIRIDRESKQKLKELFYDFIEGKTKTKSMAYYKEEWIKEWENVTKMREEAGRRTLPHPPPIILLVRFIMPDGGMRGAKSAPAVIDLSRGELRIPRYGVRVKLPQRLVEALTEENSLLSRPEFVIMITRRGLLRLIAYRYVSPTSITLPLRIIVIDENSFNGEALAVWDILAPNRVVLSHYEVLMPSNRGFIDKVAAMFQSAADGNSQSKEEVRKLLHRAGMNETKILLLLTPEKLAGMSASLLKKEKRLNNAFAERVTARIRALIREAKKRGWSVAIVSDPINYESLKGSKLQRTLLKPRRRLRNLAYYEGAVFKLYRASGKMCPKCGAWGVEIAHRRYRCPQCGIEWGRDKCATFWLAKKFLDNFKEESDDETYIDLDGWLREHPRGLL
jgi:ribosomal protein S27AE